MKVSLWLLIPIVFFRFSQGKEHFNYGTKLPEARAHYQKGWEQILDRGEWTLAEASFRKAVELDSNFLLGWSQVGRISQNPKERALIFKQLSDKKSRLTGWEKKLLEVYLGSLELIDARDRGIQISRKQISDFYSLSENHFSGFLKVYPNEIYVYSEYVEVIHGIYGSKPALDSLQSQVVKGNKLNPFLISYTAQMQADLKDFENAFQTASESERRLNNPKLPIISFTNAFIYFEKGQFESAGKFLDQTLILDKNHTLAQRLKKRLDQKSKDL